MDFVEGSCEKCDRRPSPFLIAVYVIVFVLLLVSAAVLAGCAGTAVLTCAYTRCRLDRWAQALDRPDDPGGLIKAIKDILKASWASVEEFAKPSGLVMWHSFSVLVRFSAVEDAEYCAEINHRDK